MRILTVPKLLLCLAITVVGMMLPWPAPAQQGGMPPLTSIQKEWVEQHPAIVLGMVQGGWPPFEVLDGNQPSGLAYDYLQAAASRLGMRVDIVQFTSRNALIEAACRGQIDVLINTSFSPSLTRCLVYGEPTSITPIGLVGRANDTRLLDPDLRELEIALRAPDPLAAQLKERYPASSSLPRGTDSEALKDVAEGRADAYVGNAQVAQRLIADLGLAKLVLHRPLDVPDDMRHFAVPNSKQPLVEALDAAMTGMSTEEKERIERRWLEPLGWGVESQLPASPEERAVLGKQLRLGMAPSWRPLSFVDENGVESGLAGAYVQKLREAGAHLNLVPTQSWEDVRNRMSEGTLDVVMGVPADMNGKIPGWGLSQPFISVANVIVTRTSSRERIYGPEDLRGLTVVLSDPSRLTAHILRHAPSARILRAADAQSAMQLLADGQADAYVGNLAVVDETIRNFYAGQLHIAAPAEIEDHLALAVREPFAPLETTFDRILARMGPAGQAAIRNNWLAVEYNQGLRWQEVATWALPPLAVIAAAMIVLGLAYRRVRREVAMRRQAEGRLTEVADNLPAVVYQTHRSPEGELTFPFILGDVKSLFGIPADEALADEHNLFMRLHPDDRATVVAAMEASAATAGHIDVEFRALNGDQWRWIRSRAKGMFSQDGGVVWSGYWIDVTDAREQAEALEAAVESRSEFLATMSHEIRTPMAGILGLLEVMSHGRLDPGQRKVLDTIDESAQMLRQLLDDILDLSRMEAGALQMEPLPTDMRALVSNVEQLLQVAARDRRLELRSVVDPDLAARYLVDGTRLRQVLFNLISNAIKFTEQGHVHVTLNSRTVAGDPAVHEVVIRIEDTGIGIAQDQQAVLFRPFRQANRSISRQFGGTGLGLSICHRIVAQMGGTISLQSELGVGTQVVVVLRLQVEDEEGRGTGGPLQDQQVAVFDERVRILVAEDQSVNRMLMAWRMKQMRLTSRIVNNGQEALDALKAGHFDMLITDCRMPVMDGYELAETVRMLERDSGRRRLPIIAMTASAMPEQVRRCHEVGMDDVLAKPVYLAQLNEALSRWLPRSQEGVAAAVDMVPAAAVVDPAVAVVDPALWRHLDTVPDPMAAEALFGSLAAFVGLVRRMTSDSRTALALLHAAIVGEDGDGVEIHLHALAGCFAIVGASQVADTIRATMIDLEYQGLDAQLGAVEALAVDVAALVEAFEAALPAA